MDWSAGTAVPTIKLPFKVTSRVVTSSFPVCCFVKDLQETLHNALLREP